MIKKALQFFLVLSLFFFTSGCRERPENVQETSPTPSPAPATEPPWQKHIPQQKSVAREPREPIVYLAELIQKKQFFLSARYKEYLKENPQRLRYNIAYHGKRKSIFHYPVPTMPNALIFPGVEIRQHTALHFSLGIFSNNSDNFASDGATFMVHVKGQDGTEQTLFQETLREFDVWQERRVDLSEYAGQQVNLKLLTDPYQDPNNDRAVWGEPRLVYFPNQQEVEIASAKRYSSLIKGYQGQALPPGATRVDRGWVAKAISTEILLPSAEENVVIRNELYVMERSERQDESVVIEYLDAEGTILDASTAPLSASGTVITRDYNVTQNKKVPQKVRIRLDSDQPSLVFIKEPVQFTQRTAATDTKQPNVILISLDTLRADRLGCYGYEREVSPNIDALAAESFVFTNAYSNSNWTLPAHTSMFTSIYPSEHQIILKDFKKFDFYSSEWPYYYMTKAFKEMNYLTFAFTGGGFVHSKYGFNKDFDYHIEDVIDLNRDSLNILFHLFKDYRDIPFFAFFHTYEIHDYFKEKSTYRKYVQNNFQRNDDIRLIDILTFLKDNPFDNPKFNKIADKLLSDMEIQYIRDLYDGTIAYTDNQLGVFFNKLRQMGMYDNSWIILTSDHGEGFGEFHNNNHFRSWQHGRRLYDNQIKIPLIIKPPAGVMQEISADRIDHFSQIIDIPPTILSLIGVESHNQFKGKSLLPDLTGANSISVRGLFSENINSRLFSVINNGYKLIMAPRSEHLKDEGVYDYQLYNLRNDPSEKRNLLKHKDSSKYTPIYDELKSLLDEHIYNEFSSKTISGTTLPTQATPKLEEDGVDMKHLERLKDLGYL